LSPPQAAATSPSSAHIAMRGRADRFMGGHISQLLIT
jgi:hypothetical protein